MLPLAPAFADSSTDTGSNIINGQVDLHTVTSTLTAVVDTVGGDAAVQSTAVGNALDVTTMNDTSVTNNQYVSSVEIGSYLGTAVTNVTGSVTVTNQAICNSAAVSTDPALTAVTSTQVCDAVDPAASVYVDAANIGGSLTISNMAVGNSFEADTNATNMPVTNTQVNSSVVDATTTANVSKVTGSVSVTATAAGNTAQIVHYSTD